MTHGSSPNLLPSALQVLQDTPQQMLFQVGSDGLTQLSANKGHGMAQQGCGWHIVGTIDTRQNTTTILLCDPIPKTPLQHLLTAPAGSTPTLTEALDKKTVSPCTGAVQSSLHTLNRNLREQLPPDSTSMLMSCAAVRMATASRWSQTGREHTHTHTQ